MKLEYIAPFVSSTMSVLKNVFQSEIEQGDVSLVRCSELTGDVSVVIGLHDHSGESVILNMDPSTARSICTAMNGAACESADPLGADTLGELANMIAGNAVSALSDQGFHFSVRPPVTVGRNDLPLITEGLELFQVLVTSEHGPITVNFTVRTA
jgi:chemotaxis protein CheX